MCTATSAVGDISMPHPDTMTIATLVIVVAVLFLNPVLGLGLTQETVRFLNGVGVGLGVTWIVMKLIQRW